MEEQVKRLKEENEALRLQIGRLMFELDYHKRITSERTELTYERDRVELQDELNEYWSKIASIE